MHSTPVAPLGILVRICSIAVLGMPLVSVSAHLAFGAAVDTSGMGAVGRIKPPVEVAWQEAYLEGWVRRLSFRDSRGIITYVSQQSGATARDGAITLWCKWDTGFVKVSLPRGGSAETKLREYLETWLADTARLSTAPGRDTCSALVRTTKGLVGWIMGIADSSRFDPTKPFTSEEAVEIASYHLRIFAPPSRRFDTVVTEDADDFVVGFTTVWPPDTAKTRDTTTVFATISKMTRNIHGVLGVGAPLREVK